METFKQRRLKDSQETFRRTTSLPSAVLSKGTEEFLLCMSQIYRHSFCQHVLSVKLHDKLPCHTRFRPASQQCCPFFGNRFGFCSVCFVALFRLFFRRFSFTGSLSFLAKRFEDSRCKSEIHCKPSLQLRITFGHCSLSPFVGRKLELGKWSHRFQGLVRSLGLSY